MKRLLIRADAGITIGTGHVMRCIALAQGWRAAGGEAVFALAEATPAILKRLSAEGFEVARVEFEKGSAADAKATVALAAKLGAAWVVADGYHFGAEYQCLVRSDETGLLVMDDFGHARHYSADIVLNQNLGADETLYASREAACRLLLGTEYVLLREQFNRWRNWKREIPAVARKVLVTMGGSDPDNVTGEVIAAIRELDLEVTVVTGGSNPHVDNLRQVVGGMKRGGLIVDATDMPGLMAGSDLVISAAGSTCWELAFMGVPAIMVVIAENQRLNAAQLGLKEAAVVLDHGGDLHAGLGGTVLALCRDQQTRTALVRAGRELVDGLGVSRVVEAMLRRKG